MSKKKKSTELVSQGDQQSSRGGPGLAGYLRPWAALPVLLPAGFIAHWMWGEAGWGTGLAAAAIAAAGGTVAWVTHRLTQARTWYAHNIATATIATGSAWLSASVVFGAGRPMLDILLIGGVALCAIADVHLWAAGQGAAEGASNKQRVLPSFAKVAALLDLRNVRARLLSDTEMQQRHKLSLENGETAESLQRKGKELASAYGVAPGAVRIVESSARADEAELIITKKDVMGQLIPWPGLDPAHTGTSIADHPLHLGTYEDGEPFLNEVTNRHSLTVGMAGAGKSVYGKIKIVSIADRSDTFTLAIDLAKGRQTLGPIESAIGWPAYTKPAARALLAGVKNAITARANHLAENGYAQWAKGCGLTFLYLLIEEAAETVDFDEIVETARVARSVGIQMELSLQRATHSNLDTDTRANLGDALCFGVRDDADASYVLPDYVLDSGCDPSRWRKSRPGAFYAAVEAVDPDRHTVPVKAFGPPSTDPAEENVALAEAADCLPDQDAKLDPITRRAFGAAYTAYLAEHGRQQSTAKTAAAVSVPQAAPAATPPTPQEEPDVDTDEEVDPIVLEGEDPDPEISAHIDDPIEAPEGVDLTQTHLAPPARTRESAEQGRRRLDAQLQLWTDQGVDGFTAPELGRALVDAQGLKRSRAWILKELRRREEEGQVWQDEDAKWHVLAGAADPELQAA